LKFNMGFVAVLL